MDKFIKEYLHSTEDTTLVGKFGFFADDEDIMVDIVNERRLNTWDKLTSAGNQEYPFNPLHVNKYFKLFYYDPYYKLKSAIDGIRNAGYSNGHDGLVCNLGQGAGVPAEVVCKDKVHRADYACAVLRILPAIVESKNILLVRIDLLYGGILRYGQDGERLQCCAVQRHAGTD